MCGIYGMAFTLRLVGNFPRRTPLSHASCPVFQPPDAPMEGNFRVFIFMVTMFNRKIIDVNVVKSLPIHRSAV